MSSIVPLSRLELVPLREAWPDEASNFTPWLAEGANLAHLSETLGLSLELEAVEKQVGPFAADILARDVGTQNWVLIENQIAPTDHRHLGQLLTYAAGLDARTIVWLAESFRDEHRAAIDFLNRATTGDYAFFAVEIELYRIGGSPLAPRFSIVAKPNDWNKQLQAAKQLAEGELTDIQKLNLEYWTGLIKAAAGRYTALGERSPYRQSWQRFASLRSGDPSLILNAVFSWDRGLRLEVYIDGSLAKPAFNALKAEHDEIEKAVGHELTWEELPQARASRVCLYMPGVEKRENRERWHDQYEWLLTWAPRLTQAVRPFADILDPKALQASLET